MKLLEKAFGLKSSVIQKWEENLHQRSKAQLHKMEPVLESLQIKVEGGRLWKGLYSLR